MTLIKIDPKDYSLEETKASEIQAMFNPMLTKMVELEKEYNEVTALEISKEACKKAKELRLKYVKVRTGTAEIHKTLKANSLAVGRFLDGFKNAQLMASSGIELKLSDIEKHFEKIEEQRIEALQIERSKELEGYEVAVIPSNLGSMEQSTWDIFLTGTKANFEAVKAAEKIAEEQRIEAPDKEKMLALIQLLENIEYPTTSTEHGAFIIEKVKGMQLKVCQYIKDASEKF